MVKTHKKKIKKYKNKSKKSILKGGIKEEFGLPECTVMSQFQISDANILGFKRYVKSPMDCFINALQLFGLLNELTANLLRIPTALQTYGFTKEDIEMIFILFKGNNFNFKSTHNFQEFSQQIDTYLHPGYAIFAGYLGHVFILARKLDGLIMLIDPQGPLFCNINDCQHYIYKPNTDYFILFNSPEKLTVQQLQFAGFQL